MPFALLIVGAVLVASGINGQTKQLFTLVKGDIEGTNGQHGYLYWMVTILVIGALGYIDELRPLSRAFMALVVIVLLLKNGTGFFSQLQSQLGINPNDSEIAQTTSMISTQPIPLEPIQSLPLTGMISPAV